MTIPSPPTTLPPRRLFALTAVLLLAALIYFQGLGSEYIPKNGDEYPYAHITRETAASGQLLPLRSELDHMRNTKPPLLFWQGIASTNWGQNWSLVRLRYPNVIYTLLTAGLVLLLAARLANNPETGVIGALAFLAFFNTYRYGRPFLTDPPLVFWLGLPFFILLYWRPRSFDSRLVVPLTVSVALGFGLLYKSFALLAPTGLALAWWYLHERDYRLKEFLRRDSWKIIANGGIALAIFSLWFLLDPDPAAIWQEFVVGENAGKFDPHFASYLKEFFWGSASAPMLVLDLLANGGLLIFPLAALFVLAFRERHQMPPAQRLLWIWVSTLFIIFALPSQRSGRYLLPAMPALAVLLALAWEKIPRRFFLATLGASGLLLALATFLALQLQQQIGVTGLYPWPFWLLLLASGALIVTGISQPRYSRRLSLVVPILLYLVFSCFVAPFDGPLGNYSPEVQAQMRGRQVTVPSNFRAQEERFRFLLPGAEIQPYSLELKLTPGQLAERYPLFAVQLPIVQGSPATVQAACPDCRIVGQRLDIRSRHSGAELKEMFLGGRLFELLFVREYLLTAPATATPDAMERPK